MAINAFGDEIIEDSTSGVNAFGDVVIESPRTLKPSTQATIDEREAFGQQLQKEAQAPASEKAIAGALGIGKSLVSPVVAGVKAIPGLVDLAFQPEKIVPTLAEGGRRAGMDVGQLIADTVSRFPKSAAQLALLGPYAPFAQVYDALKPKTLTPEEIQRAFEAQPMKEAVARERTTVPTGFPFQGAQPQVSEAIAEIAPLVLPVKGLKSLKGESLEADVGRSVRSAIKATDARVANQIEKAAPQEMGDIFARNPNADKMGAFPTEGFGNEVQAAYQEAGNLISELRARSGSKFQAGDQIASMIEDRAARAEKAGLKEKAEEMRKIAEEKRGAMQDINSLQDAVTEANRQSNIFAPKTSAQELADEIIAKEGGRLINKDLESLAGEEGLTARKSWSNLKVINDNLQKRVNKLINSAPPQVQSVIGGSLNSIQGMGSLMAVLNGHIAAGLPPLVESAVRSFMKKAAKEAASSDAIITKMYDQLRKNPPVSTLGQPAIMPLNVGGVRPQPSPTVPSEPTLQEFIQNSLRQQPQASF